MGFKQILLASAFALSTFAAPIPECDGANPAPALTAEILIKIDPTTASCSLAKIPGECADATRAAPAINKSFATYGITSTGEQAALVAYMLFESVSFQFNRNQVPGRAGQGTKMMAMPDFVAQYATAVVGADAVATASAIGGNDGLNAVLNLVIADDEKSFGSAAWFLTTKCTPEIRQGLVAETVEGWHNFLTQCVQTEVKPQDDPRDLPWIAAKQAMLSY